MAKGKFIVLDGIDASGKGTIVMMLAGYLEEKGLKEKLVVTFEPSSGKFGQEVRELLKKESDPKKNAQKCLELYVKDRADHLKNKVLPALKEGKIVLCDRFKYSTLAYQGAQGVPLKKILKLHEKMIKPDLALILNADVGQALARIESDPKRGAFDKFEKKAFLDKVKANFMSMHKLLPKENIQYIDANLPIEKVFLQAKEEVDKLLKL